MLIGGVAPGRWEDKKLQPRIDALKAKEGTTVAEKERALILLSTFMVAAGLLTGEAFFGTESSILSFVDSLWYNEDGTQHGDGRGELCRFDGVVQHPDGQFNSHQRGRWGRHLPVVQAGRRHRCSKSVYDFEAED